MKKIVLLLVSVFVSTYLFAQYDVEYVSSTASSITLKSRGFNKNMGKALKDAELSALKTVLFYGVNDATLSYPLISEDETEVEKKYSKYFKKLYDEEYKKFITSEPLQQKIQKDRAKKKYLDVKVTINIKALRDNLETNKIIRKFGL